MLVILIIVTVLAVIGATAYLSVKDGDLAELRASDGHLVVIPRGLNAIWALSRQITLPYDAITAVRREVPRREVPGGVRAPGTHVPGVIKAGTYRTRGSKSFWLVGRAQTVTVIECTGQRFDRLVLETSPVSEQVLSSIGAETPPAPTVDPPD